MSDYVKLDDLRNDAERDVEVNGRKYRIRRLSPFELMLAYGGLAIAPDGSESPRIDPERAATIAPKLLASALVVPKLDEGSLYLLPPEDVDELQRAILELSGLTRPFDGDDSGGT